MQFKKVISLVLVVILLLSLTVFSTSAADATTAKKEEKKFVQLVVEASSATNGENSFVVADETIEVKVTIPEGKNPGVAYMMFDVKYDVEVLDLDEKSISTDIFTMGSPELDRKGIIIDEENGRVTFMTDMLVHANITSVGTVATLSFVAKKDACKDVAVAVENFIAFNSSDDAVKTVAGSANLTVHAFDEGKQVAPTCTEDGYKTYTCTKCAVSYDAVDESSKALGHDMSKASCTEASECSRCGLEGAKAAGHSFSIWKVETEADEGVEGLKSRSCSVCGEKETEKIPALPEGDSSLPVVAIVIIVIVVVAAAGFCVYWFVIRKK
jgi:flagellar basal body-associated protein FliL